eukprot:m.5855 g.5855  ORF g.5855 m.5855 type:complete len:64 (+) comp4706_c0_seq1:915-1106(+)
MRMWRQNELTRKRTSDYSNRNACNYLLYNQSHTHTRTRPLNYLYIIGKASNGLNKFNKFYVKH